LSDGPANLRSHIEELPSGGAHGITDLSRRDRHRARAARWTLPHLPESITVRELIRHRVREEVARHNARPGHHFAGLVQPLDAEAELNGYRLRSPRRIEWEQQADIAERAFATNGFFVLVGDHQAEDLDDVVDLASDPDVAFVKLVPMVGG
jgi:hypothetical protein